MQGLVPQVGLRARPLGDILAMHHHHVGRDEHVGQIQQQVLVRQVRANRMLAANGALLGGAGVEPGQDRRGRHVQLRGSSPDPCADRAVGHRLGGDVEALEHEVVAHLAPGKCRDGHALVLASEPLFAGPQRRFGLLALVYLELGVGVEAGRLERWRDLRRQEAEHLDLLGAAGARGVEAERQRAGGLVGDPQRHGQRRAHVARFGPGTGVRPAEIVRHVNRDPELVRLAGGALTRTNQPVARPGRIV